MSRLAVAGLVLLMSSAGVLAQTKTPVPAPAASEPKPPVSSDPCHADVQKYCHGIEPGMGRIAFCMFDNRTHLSPRCHQLIQNLYDIDTNLAAQAHEPLKQFLLEAYQRRAHETVVDKKVFPPKPGTSPSTTPAAPPANQTTPK